MTLQGNKNATDKWLKMIDYGDDAMASQYATSIGYTDQSVYDSIKNQFENSLKWTKIAIAYSVRV